MSLPDNRLKQSLANGQTTYGTWCLLPSATATEAAAAAGLDFVVIDLEHGTASLETVEHMVRAAETAGCTALVRSPSTEPWMILRCLETGTAGVLVPQIETAEQARAVTEAARYHPSGSRGLAPYTRNHGFTHENLPTSLAVADARTLVGVLVEGEQGMTNLSKITAVDGVDIVYLGIYDLSQSVGHPGDLDHPRVREALRSASQQITAAGRYAGSFARDAQDARLLRDTGFTFIAHLADTAALNTYYRNFMAEASTTARS
ncbi:aldolase [Streptomyces sp. SID4928]|uniref:HpcH/HpaI aldolase family protein n=1 Tax=unclassified Streptomyces TaxID=2593676 RepID=UPI0001C19C24|nr:aldolase/citrate lyase family protein [Streptomyces sp. ACT-1]EGE39622.1 4-hydroxy-2-oxovalerate aldolase [Streptomyces sp. ACT-1]MYR47711.1 aldolase [Streptomyces sp. SID4928]